MTQEGLKQAENKRLPCMIVHIISDSAPERWALFNLTEKQKEIIRGADDADTCEKRNEDALIVLRIIPASEAGDSAALDHVIPAEDIARGWKPQMHPDWPNSPVESFIIHTDIF